MDLVNPAKCKHVLQTVKGSVLNQGPGISHTTVLCAGSEGGGKDACQVGKLFIYLSIYMSVCLPPTHASFYLSCFLQGDSGGPLVCQTGSSRGHWLAFGVTSWGKGCGRSWGNNSSRHPSKRGSPGVFTDVRLLLPWIKQRLREGRSKTSCYFSTNSDQCQRQKSHLDHARTN